MTARIGDIIEALGALAPWELAENWDHAGLQVGDRAARVDTVTVALDPGPREIQRALKAGARLLVTHHPLLFHPLREVDLGQSEGDLLARIIKGGLAVVSAHTNLDSAPGGLADHLASRLGLTGVESLGRRDDLDYLNMVVYTPESTAEKVANALKEAGAGLIGRYRGCYFASRGMGVFTAMPGATPRAGVVGREERVAEIRLETRILRREAGRMLAAVRGVHPYEEPVVDLHPLLGSEPGVGPGRVGNRAVAASRLLADVKRVLGIGSVRTVGKPPRRIGRVAVLPGSGGDFVEQACQTGSDVLVTGEVRYHQALAAQARGLWLIEAGHRATEAPAVGLMVRHLKRCSRQRGWNLRLMALKTRGDIFVTR